MTDEISTLEDGQAEAITPEVVELSLRESIEQAANPEPIEEAPEAEEQEELNEAEESTEEVEFDLPNEIKSWSVEEQDAFRALREAAPEQAQMLFDNRFGKINSAFHDKSEQLAEYKRNYDAIGALLEPHKDAMARAGMSPVDAINKLMAVNNQLTTDPQAAIKDLARANNVSLTDLIGGDETEDDYVDPKVKKLEDDIAQLKSQQNQVTQNALLEQQNKINQSVQAFASSVDDSGNPQHPHFDALEPKMTELATKGVSSDLQELYDIALSMDKDLRSAAMPSSPVTTVKTAAQKQAQVDKAKLAGRAVKTGKVTAGTDEDFTSLSIRDQLKRHGL